MPLAALGQGAARRVVDDDDAAARQMLRIGANELADAGPLGHLLLAAAHVVVVVGVITSCLTSGTRWHLTIMMTMMMRKIIGHFWMDIFGWIFRLVCVLCFFFLINFFG